MAETLAEAVRAKRIVLSFQDKVTTLLVSQEITHFFRTDIRLGELSFSSALQECLSGRKSNA